MVVEIRAAGLLIHRRVGLDTCSKLDFSTTHCFYHYHWDQCLNRFWVQPGKCVLCGTLDNLGCPG